MAKRLGYDYLLCKFNITIGLQVVTRLKHMYEIMFKVYAFLFLKQDFFHYLCVSMFSIFCYRKYSFIVVTY